jgi:XTP/dITP diphosphohydrolase
VNAPPSAPRLVIATTNEGKLREIDDALRGVPYTLSSLSAWKTLVEPDESALTFAGNARIKALSYAEQTGGLVVAEDSGLIIDALGGWPGVMTARVTGSTYPEKWAEVYRRLGEVNLRASPARFVCALALARDGTLFFETAGIIEGVIAEHPTGDGGFGYDPIFFHPPTGRTLAQMDLDEKRRLSHRGHAFAKLRSFLLASPLGPF